MSSIAIFFNCTYKPKETQQCLLCAHGIIAVRREREGDTTFSIDPSMKCEFIRTGLKSGVRELHLKEKHSFTDADLKGGPRFKIYEELLEVVKKGRWSQPTLQQTAAATKKRQDNGDDDDDVDVVDGKLTLQERRQCCAFACCHFSFSCCENQAFREFCAEKMVIKNRNVLAKKMVQCSHEMLQKVYQHFCGKRVALAIDSSTVWQRYVAVILMCGYDKVCIALVSDEDPAFDGELTADKVATFLKNIIVDLMRKRIVVINVVADNGSNFQNAIQANRSLTFGVRCLAHGFNNFTHHILLEVPSIKSKFDMLKTKVENDHLFADVPRMVATRWSSAATMFKGAIEVGRKENVFLRNELDVLESICEVLQKICACIDIVQADGANLYDGIRALALCWDVASNWIPNARDGVAPLLAIYETVLKNNIISEPLLFIAYLSKCVPYNMVSPKVGSIISSFVKSDTACRIVHGQQQRKQQQQQQQQADGFANERRLLNEQFRKISSQRRAFRKQKRHPDATRWLATKNVQSLL